MPRADNFRLDIFIHQDSDNKLEAIINLLQTLVQRQTDEQKAQLAAVTAQLKTSGDALGAAVSADQPQP